MNAPQTPTYLHPNTPTIACADLGLRQWQLADGDAVAAVNCLYDLVQQHQRVQEAREAAQDEAHKAKVKAEVAGLTSQIRCHAKGGGGACP